MNSNISREPKVNNFYKNGFDNFLEFRKASKVEYGGLTAMVLERIPRDAREILDIGCGDGYISSLLMKNFQADFYLLDQSSLAIEKAKEKALGAMGFISEDITSYLQSVQNGRFDAMIALNSLYGVEITKEFADSLMDKVSQNGVFMLALATGRSHFVELQKKYWSRAHADPF